jgi:hypothetical protein
MATLISALSTLTGSVNNNAGVFPILDQTISSTASRNKKARITTHNLFYSNNFTVVGLSGGYGNYFGTGADGNCTISSSAQVSASLNNTLYGDTIVKNYQDLTINGGILFSPLRACRGMIIYCTGNLTINGTISMTGKGGGVGNKIASPIGIASSTDSRYDLVDATLYFNNLSSSAAGGRGIPTHWNWAPSGSAWFSNFKIRVPLSGSVAGGVAGSGAGGAGIFSCGGGGAGGNSPYSPGWIGGNGGRGTIFSGGGGGSGGGDGGGFPTSTTVFEVGATAYGGAGGGAGSPLGVYTPSWAPTVAGTAGGDGVGGLLLLIVRGNITINGTVSNNGRNGGNGGLTNNAVQCGGGGGSGGGRTIIIYGGTYTNAGSVVVNGGSGGSGYGAGGSGGSGGAGSTTVKKVHV